MSQFDRYDNPTMQRECDWEVFIDKDNPNIINIRFGRHREITLPFDKYQWEDGQKFRILDIPAYDIHNCDFAVNGMLEEIVHFVGEEGIIGIPNKLFEHHGNAQCFINHMGEDNTTVVRVVNFKINARPKPEDYVSPDDEPSFREWIQGELDKGTIKDITEEESLEDEGVNIITITMNDDNTYTFYVHNGSKGDQGEPGVTPNFTIGEVTSVESYMPPYVTITGTQENPVLNFGLVKGSNGQGVELRNVQVLEDSGSTRGEVVNVGAVVGRTTYDIKLYNIRGANGYDGTDGDKIDNANIYEDSGLTRVELTQVGITEHGGRIYDFDFYNIKGADGKDGEGVPTGGTTGQILAKTSDEDYDTEWIDPTTEIDVDDHLDTESENPVQNKVLANIIPYKADYTYVNSKVDDLTTAIGTKADTSDLPDSNELVPSFALADANKVLAVANDGESTEWVEIPQPQNELPDIETGDAGKVLAVNQAEDGVEWITPQGGSDLPDIQSGDAGKVLTVNQAETGTEWSEVPKELPAVSSVDSGKALMVNSSGNWVADNIPNELPSVTSGDEGKVLQVSNLGEWVANQISVSGAKTIVGSGAPTSVVVANVGDFYRDNTNNKFYQCTQYVDSSTTTDLTGITLTLNNDLHSGLYALVDGAVGQTPVSILFTSNGNSYEYFNVWYNDYSGSCTLSYGDTVYPYKENEGYWLLPEYKTISITGGTDATDPDVINFFITNSNVGGSTWIEVVAKDIRVPDVTSIDEGKVLTVNSSGVIVADSVPTELPAVTGEDDGKVLGVDNGAWAVVNAGSGGGTTCSFHGDGVPNSNVGSGVGDLYRDDLTGNIYIVTSYIPRPLTITSLAGLSITMNLEVLKSETAELPSYTYNCGTSGSGTLRIFNGDNELHPQYKTHLLATGTNSVIATGWDYGTWSQQLLRDNSDPTKYSFYWSNSTVKVTFVFPETFNSGQPAEEQSVVDFFVNNASSINNFGCTWALASAKDNRLPDIASGDTGKVLLANASSNPRTYYLNTLWQPPAVNYLADGAVIVYKYLSGNGCDYNNIYSGIKYAKNFLWKESWGGAINNGADLNNSYTTIGNYYKDGTRTITNAPTTSTEFSLVVEGPNGSLSNPGLGNNQTIIRKITDADANMYIQKVQNVSGVTTYGDWKKVATGIPDITSSDVGKLLTVDSNGEWTKSNAFEEETFTFTLTDNSTVTKTLLVKVVS